VVPVHPGEDIGRGLLRRKSSATRGSRSTSSWAGR